MADDAAIIELRATSSKLAGDMKQAAVVVEKFAGDVRQSGAEMGDAFVPSMNKIGGSVDGVLGKFQNWRREQVQQGRQARFLAGEILSVVPAGEGAKSAIQGMAGVLIEGAAGGLSFGLAFEAAKVGIGLFTEATRKAEEQAAKTKETLKKLRDEIDGIGKSQIQAGVEQAAKLRNTLDEFYAAGSAFSDTGRNAGTGSAEEDRLDRATKKVHELAVAYGVTDDKIASTESLAALLAEKVAAIESAARNKGDQAQAEQQEKDRARQVDMAKSANAEILRQKVDLVAKMAEVERKQESARAMRGPASVGDFATLEAPAFSVDETQFAKQLFDDKKMAEMKKQAQEMKAMWAEVGASMGRAIGTAFADMVTGSKSVGQAMAEMAKSILSTIIEMVMKIVMANAVNAASGAAASQASTPVVGPILAASAMVAMLAMVQGLVSSMPSAATGWDRVPYDMPVMVHKGERITPKYDVDRQEALAAAGRGARGGLTVNLNGGMLDGRSVERVFGNNDSQVMRALRKMQRRIG